jgi:MFS family permease
MSNQIKLDYRWQAWAIVISAGLFFFFEFLQMTMFNSISEDLMQSFNIAGTRFGILSAAYFYANVVFLFPAGLMLDRFSTRKLILTGLALCIIATIGMSLASNYWLALTARFVIGMASTLCFLSASRLATRWFPSHQLALATGVIVTMAMLGGFFGQTPISLLVQHYGWRHALLLNAVLGVLFWIVILFVVRDFPANFKAQHQENLQTLKQLGFWSSIIKAITQRQNWLAGLYTSLLNLSIFIIGSSFGTLFFTQVHGFSMTEASFASSMIFLGTIFGSPIIGAASDKLKNRRAPMIICAIISLLLLLLVFYDRTLHYDSIVILMFAIGFFTSSQIITYPLISESNPKAFTSSAIGMASVLIMAGGAIFVPLFGWLLTLNWKHIYVNHIAFYSSKDFYLALMILPIAVVISLICVLMAKETYAKESN